MAIGDHFHRAPKLRAKITTVDPTQRLIEVVTIDGAARRLAIWDVPSGFTWPAEGEDWSIFEENGYWKLGNKFLSPDESATLESLAPGERLYSVEEIAQLKTLLGLPS